MPIALTCGCGRAMRIKEEYAGRKVRCPDCRGVVTVPEPTAPPQIDELEVLNAEPAEAERETLPSRAAVTARRPTPPRDEEDAGIQEESRRRPAADEPRPSRPEPKRRPRPRVRRNDRPRVAFEGGWFGSANAGVAGGLLMILIAAVWFFAGLAAGIIFFYPPILFIIGVVAFIKGLAGGRD